MEKANEKPTVTVSAYWATIDKDWASTDKRNQYCIPEEIARILANNAFTQEECDFVFYIEHPNIPDDQLKKLAEAMNTYRKDSTRFLKCVNENSEIVEIEIPENIKFKNRKDGTRFLKCVNENGEIVEIEIPENIKFKSAREVFFDEEYHRLFAENIQYHRNEIEKLNKDRLELLKEIQTKKEKIAKELDKKYKDCTSPEDIAAKESERQKQENDIVVPEHVKFEAFSLAMYFLYKYLCHYGENNLPVFLPDQGLLAKLHSAMLEEYEPQKLLGWLYDLYRRHLSDGKAAFAKNIFSCIVLLKQIMFMDSGMKIDGKIAYKNYIDAIKDGSMLPFRDSMRVLCSKENDFGSLYPLTHLYDMLDIILRVMPETRYWDIERVLAINPKLILEKIKALGLEEAYWCGADAAFCAGQYFRTNVPIEGCSFSIGKHFFSWTNEDDKQYTPKKIPKYIGENNPYGAEFNPVRPKFNIPDFQNCRKEKPTFHVLFEDNNSETEYKRRRYQPDPVRSSNYNKLYSPIFSAEEGAPNKPYASKVDYAAKQQFKR